MISGKNQILTTKKNAVVLFQLGGPDSLEAVEPFLFNLFMDPKIINFPLAFLARKPLAKLISAMRSTKVQNNYKLIGEKSPILDLTQRQANALSSRLVQQGVQAEVFIAMRYWHPLISEIVSKIKVGGFDQIILVPLYPQFSQATTGSSISEWNRQAKKQGLNILTQVVCCYPNHPALIAAFVENINKSLSNFSPVRPENIDLVFSAHGVPLSYIKKGDPYQLHIEETVHQVMEHGKWKSPHTICFQSNVGPMRWLKPSLIETVERLANEGHKYLLIIPISFVTDHIETLHEINIEAHKYAMAHGVQQFELMPMLNDHPKFIDCLTELVSQELTHTAEYRTCEMLWQAHSNKPMPKKCLQINKLK